MHKMAWLAAVLAGTLVLVVTRPAPHGARAVYTYELGDRVVLDHLRPLTAEAEAEAMSPAQRVTVLAFLGADCPVSRHYASALAQLVDAQDPALIRGMGVVINAAEDSRWPVDTFADPGGHLGAQLGVVKTPHFVVLDAEHRLVYSGAFDSGRTAVTESYVGRAIADVVSGAPVALPETRTFGSPLPQH